MGYRFFGEKELLISHSLVYKKAVFGLFHVVFLDEEDNIYLAIEDYDSIKESIFFYEMQIKNRKRYPIFDGNKFIDKGGSDEEVLKQVLGFPQILWERLDKNSDILSQLHFRSDLSNLKKDCYIQYTGDRGGKWYADYFRSYCLSHGIFFLYDETKPFVEEEHSTIPVFFNESKFSSDFQLLYRESGSSRFAIDFLCRTYDERFVRRMKAFDSYSLSRRVSYFINEDFDEELHALDGDPVFERKYRYLLKQYIASLINTLYDQFSLEVLNRLTVKNSYLTKGRVVPGSDIVCISSFYGEMYSQDKIHFYFASLDRKRILASASSLIDTYGNSDILGIYARLCLPYDGFQYVKELSNFSAEDLVNSMPFCDWVNAILFYSSCKRFDLYYSYVCSQRENHYVLFERFLLSQGFLCYPLQSFFDVKFDREVYINIFPMQRCESLTHLLDQRCSLASDILPSFLLYNKEVYTSELEMFLSEIDERSDYKSCSIFYSLFQFRTLEDVIDILFARLDIKESPTEEIMDFFAYLLVYPFYVAEMQCRDEIGKFNDLISLQILDTIAKKDNSFEPNMPYPFVTKGYLGYSFRKTYFGKSYLCSCESEAIQRKIKFLGEKYDALVHSEAPEKKNAFIVRELGLPWDVTNRMDLSKDIFSQLSFREHICHTCIGAEPTIHDDIDYYEGEDYNIYLSYIRTNACLHGLFFNQNISVKNARDDIIPLLRNHTYYSLINVDPNNMDGILKPYLQVDKTMLACLLFTTLKDKVPLFHYLGDMISFLELDITVIRQMMFSCSEDLYPLVYKHARIFNVLLYIYKMLEVSYALYVSERFVSSNFHEFCLNMDYNARLPYPYVLLGNIFDAYTSDPIRGEYYFCECDKEVIKKSLENCLENNDVEQLPSEIRTPFILTAIGLPYLVVYHWKNFDFSTNDISSFMSKLSFKEEICRDCTSINHCAFDEIFRKSYPYKEDSSAELRFVRKRMMKDGLFFVYPAELDSFKMPEGYRFDLKAQPYYSKIASCYFEDLDHMPEILLRVFRPTKLLMDDIFDALEAKKEFSSEALASAHALLIDSYLSNPDIFFKANENVYDADTLREFVLNNFPEVNRIRSGIVDTVFQVILYFFHMLEEIVLDHYLEKEKKVGK